MGRGRRAKQKLFSSTFDMLIISR